MSTRVMASGLTQGTNGRSTVSPRNPRPVGRAKLAGRDDYRIHVGDYRVVYAVDDTEGLVIVARIAHRREVYRR
jgi:mRNA-degrading endonuclease RelE of RelBE toxin-antitoxin system